MNILGRFVAGQNNLFVFIVQFVESVEKLLLRGFPARNELDVINHQQIHHPQLRTKLIGFLLLNRLDHLVHKAFAGHIEDPLRRVFLVHIIADGLHQVRFPQPHAAVDKQRIVGFSGRFRRSECRGPGEPVAVSGNKGVESVFGIEMRVIVISCPGVDFSSPGVCFVLAENQRSVGFPVRFGQTVFNHGKVFFLNHRDHRLHFGADDHGIAFHVDGKHIILDPCGVGKVIHAILQQGAGRSPE